MKKSFAITLAAALSLSVCALASAGQTAPLSALQTLPTATSIRGAQPGTIAGIKLKTSAIGRNKETKWHELTTSEGFCFSDTDVGAHWTNTAGSSERNPVQDLDLNHLVDKDGKTTLERTKVRFDPSMGTVTATARTHVELTEVAKSREGAVVFAFREGTNIVLIARNGDSGMESHTLASDSSMVAFVSADGCAFSGVRIDARKPEAGAIAQMGITIPPPKGEKGGGTRLVVDASLSKLTRDPEPKLSVRIRST